MILNPVFGGPSIHPLTTTETTTTNEQAILFIYPKEEIDNIY
jgi:hypothetical protein